MKINSMQCVSSLEASCGIKIFVRAYQSLPLSNAYLYNSRNPHVGSFDLHNPLCHGAIESCQCHWRPQIWPPFRFDQFTIPCEDVNCRNQQQYKSSVEAQTQRGWYSPHVFVVLSLRTLCLAPSITIFHRHIPRANASLSCASDNAQGTTCVLKEYIY